MDTGHIMCMCLNLCLESDLWVLNKLIHDTDSGLGPN